MRNLRRKVLNVCFGLAIVLPTQGYSAPGVLADQPLYLSGGRGVPANLVLTPSVEFPTVESVANIDNNYSSRKEFVGYFNSDRCYIYNYAEVEAERYFSVSSESSNRTCGGAEEWSGNFLNWAATQTIDPFRKALTGGYRVKDEVAVTWLEKARHPGDGNDRNFPNRVVNDNTEIRNATPFDADAITAHVRGLGSEMRFSLGTTGVDTNPTDYNPDDADLDESRAQEISIRLEVCNPNAPGGVESNCVEYSNNNWKPEGLIQENADKVRYSVFGYLLESSKTRDGGVLRAAQKFVGPQLFDASNGGLQDNPNKEWDPDTGIIYPNPDPSDAQATSAAAGPGVTINNSGVINYINKFGQTMVPGAPYYDEVATYVASSSTINFNKRHDPVSELYYAATRYLKGQGNVSEYSSLAVSDNSKRDMLRTKWLDGFPVITDWVDPIQYECQPNAILGIGDTNTGQDKNLPGNTSSVDEPSKPSAVSEDSTVDVVEETNRVGYIEGATTPIGEGSNFNSAKNSAYIAGLAYNNHVKDIRPEATMPGKQTISTHWVDVAEFQTLRVPIQNQYYLAAKYGGFEVPDDFDPDTRTDALPESLWHTNGETVTVGDTSFKRPDNYYVAAQADRMISSLETAFENILAEVVGSSTGVTFNTATLETDTLLFGARFDSANWTGDLFATGLTENASGPPTIDATETWEGGAVLDARDLDQNSRQIITYDGADGLAFTWGNWASFTTRQQDDLKYDGGAGSVTLAENRVSYLRGNAITGMRERASLLGDIINSTPVYVARPDLGWPTGAPFGTTTDTYAAFRSDQRDRTPVVYVGANDGMLHAFRGSDGEELFGYIPEFIFSDDADEGLHFLTQPSYQHRYYVDLTPVISDVYTQGPGNTAEAWRTILIGGARTGGKGIFALDVTNPGSFSEANASDLVMWEFSSEDDGQMGYIIEPPTVSLVKWANNDYRWTAFVPNGYNSTEASTGLFMLDIEAGLDGVWEAGDYRYIEFDSEADATGLGPVRQVDLNGDRIVDRVYAGDLKGNIWVAEGSGNGTWDSAYSAGGGAAPLFTAERSGVAQPVTAAPMVIRNPVNDDTNPDPDIMVLFGTGQYLTQEDTVNEEVQSFYGVLDRGTSELDRSDLISREIVDSAITVDGESFDVRASTGEDFDVQDGWYVDFTTELGERIVQAPQVRGEYVFVNSTIPSSNPCDVGGSGWLMAFGLDGKTPDRAVWPKLGVPVVGFKTEGGLPNRSGFLGNYALIPRSDSEVLSEEVDVGGAAINTGRMSWQELYD